MSDRQFSAAEVRISKCISRILRHRPEEAGVAMDEHGWVDTEALVKALDRQGYIVDSDCLDRMVYGNSKTRFAYNGDKTKIRACHGHTVKVDVELKAARTPKFLYHGTVGENTDSIAAEGLLPMKRLYVHLSADVETAQQVAGRRKTYLLAGGKRDMACKGCTAALSGHYVIPFGLETVPMRGHR